MSALDDEVDRLRMARQHAIDLPTATIPPSPAFAATVREFLDRVREGLGNTGYKRLHRQAWDVVPGALTVAPDGHLGGPATRDGRFRTDIEPLVDPTARRDELEQAALTAMAEIILDYESRDHTIRLVPDERFVA